MIHTRIYLHTCIWVVYIIIIQGCIDGDSYPPRWIQSTIVLISLQCDRLAARHRIEVVTSIIVSPSNIFSIIFQWEIRIQRTLDLGNCLILATLEIRNFFVSRIARTESCANQECNVDENVAEQQPLDSLQQTSHYCTRARKSRRKRILCRQRKGLEQIKKKTHENPDTISIYAEKSRQRDWH